MWSGRTSVFRLTAEETERSLPGRARRRQAQLRSDSDTTHTSRTWSAMYFQHPPKENPEADRCSGCRDSGKAKPWLDRIEANENSKLSF